MNIKYSPLKSSAIVLFTGILSCIFLTGCPEEQTCCPEIVSFFAAPAFICGENCLPDENSTAIYTTINYLENGKPCKPSQFKVHIMNNRTTGKIEDPIKNINWIYTPPGTYQATILQKNLKRDTTWYEIFIPACSTPIKTCNVQILPDPYTFKLCTSKGDYDNSGGWHFPAELQKYGKGIIIDTIVNPKNNPYAITFQYAKLKPHTLFPGDPPSTIYKGKQIGYSWKISINEWKDYNNNPNKNDFCLNVSLSCLCSK